MKSLLLKFLHKVGKPSEIELFWNKFRQIPRIRFALIRIEYDVLEDSVEELAENISYMIHLNIYPVLLLDLSSKTDDEGQHQRISDAQASKLFPVLADRLISEMAKHNCPAEVVSEAADAESKRQHQWDLDIDKIQSTLNKDHTPILSPFSKRKKRRIYLDPSELCRLYLTRLTPFKYIQLIAEGGILNCQERIIPFLNLSQRSEWKDVHPDMKSMVKEVRQLFNTVPDCAAIFTSAEHLLQEIFTIKGRGTYIKMHPILSTSKMRDLDITRLRVLLEDAFSKNLVDDFFSEKFKMIFYEKDYEGVAIIKNLKGIPYLDKLAVSPISEGTGLGKSLWLAIAKAYPKLIWRASPKNPLNSFYLRECQGCMKFPKWQVYWRNLDEEEILPAVKRVLEIRSTMIEIR
jgi:acetylglutamate synthase